MEIGIFAIAAALLASGAPAEAPADWRALAACAAAYRANAAIADPERPAAMSAQVSEVGDDYARAAIKAFRARGVASTAAARRAVEAYAAKRRQAFAGQSREAIDRFIEACPQTEAD
jgi:hypothetical protein